MSMFNSRLLQILAESQRVNQFAGELQHRNDSTQMGIATNNDDPLGLRRLKLTTAAKGGLTETDYVMRVLPCPYWDPPLPVPGVSLALTNFDGNPHDGVWAGVMVNQTNPPFAKADPINDDWRVIPGAATLQVGRDRDTTIGQNETHRTEQNHTINVGQKLRLQNDAGAYIELQENGAVLIGDAFGNTITLGGASAGLGMGTNLDWNSQSTVNWNLNGQSLNITNPANVTVAGKSVIVVGSTDSDGDINNSRGY
jgi:hypothetical protein